MTIPPMLAQLCGQALTAEGGPRYDQEKSLPARRPSAGAVPVRVYFAVGPHRPRFDWAGLGQRLHGANRPCRHAHNVDPNHVCPVLGAMLPLEKPHRYLAGRAVIGARLLGQVAVVDAEMVDPLVAER